MANLPSALPALAPAGLRILLLVAVATLSFASSLKGGWVYDDQPQILQNHLIQQPGLAGQALLSDVWAFKQSDDVPVSNYWRPTFVAWLIVNERVFGLDDPLPWRVALLLLHALVCLVVLRLNRQLGLATWPAFAVALLFAVHPIHVESVAWISGATDPLLGLFLLLALSAIVGAERASRGADWLRGVALTAYALALGSKEVAVMMPLLIPFVLACGLPESRWRRRFLIALPYLALAVCFLVARVLVLQKFQLALPSELSPLDLLINGPQLLLFYLGQSLWPVPLSPNYGLRALRTLDPWSWQLILQWLAAATFVIGCAWRLRRSPLSQLGLALFVLLLLPAFNLNAFPTDQIVHDRYLYLPILGLLLIVAAIFPRRKVTLDVGHQWWRRLPQGAGAVFAIAFLWGGMAWSYARIWSDELSLWQRAVDVDARSASSWAALAHLQSQRGMPEAAKASIERAIELAPVTSAYLLRADLALAASDSTSAEKDLRKVLASFPAFRPAIERLALLLQRGQRLDEATALLQSFRHAAPQFACRTDTDLAILDYLRGDKAMTRQLLKSAETQSEKDRSGPCLAALFHLAQLSSEQGDQVAALQLARRYLSATATLRDRSSQALRPQAQQLSDRLSQLATQ